MNSDRIKEIQMQTAYPQSVSVHQALLKVWNECEQKKVKMFTKENMYELADVLKKSALRLENLNVMELEARNFIESLNPLNHEPKIKTDVI